MASLLTEMLSGTNGFYLACGSFVLWYLFSSIVTWYKLRHAPGPFLAKFSYIWLARTAQRARQYYVFKDLCKKYGPLVRVGPNELTTDDPEILRRIAAVRGTYGKDPWYTGTRFNPWYVSGFHGLVANTGVPRIIYYLPELTDRPNHDVMFTTLDISLHDRMKSQIGASINGREIPLLESGIDEQVNALIVNVRQNMLNSSTIDLAPLMSYLTMDVITKVAFGQEYGYLNANQDLYSFLKEVRDNWPKMAMMVDVPHIRNILLNPLSLRLFGPSVTDTKGMGKLMGVAREYVSRRYDPDAKAQKDLLGSWIRNGLNKDQAEVEGLFMIIAGSDTTASALRITMLSIMTCPRVYNKLKKEIRDAVIDRKVANPIKFEEAKQLSYLQAVVYEGLRMRPPAHGLFPKAVPPEGDHMHGMFIPGGTAIGMNTASLFASTTNFGDDAALFRPERFVEADEQKRAEMERLVELGFGYGRFQCAGKPVAFMELNKVVFELLRTFDFQVANPTNPWKSQSYIVFVEEDMWVKVSEAEELC